MSQSDNKNELANLDFPTRALNLEPKKLPLGIKLLRNLANGMTLLQNLPNGKKILQIYRAKILGVLHTYTPTKSLYEDEGQRRQMHQGLKV